MQHHSITIPVHFGPDCLETKVDVDFLFDEPNRAISDIEIKGPDLDFGDLETEVQEGILAEIGTWPLRKSYYTFE